MRARHSKRRHRHDPLRKQRHEAKVRRMVDRKPEPGWKRAVREHMAEMHPDEEVPATSH